MLFTDLRGAARSLAGSWVLSLVIVLTLALGIGASVAIFSVLRGVIVAPLPFPDSSELVMVWERNIPRERERNVVSPANFLDWRVSNEVFDALSAVSPRTVTLVDAGSADEAAAALRLPIAAVTGDFFDLLGVSPALGRAFTEDEASRREPLAVLSHALWSGLLGGDPDVLGRRLVLSEREYTVIGVMPDSFRFDLEPTTYSFAVRPALYTPLPVTEEWRERSGRALLAVARLRDGVGVERAAAEMDAIAAGLEASHPEFNTGWRTTVVPLKEQIVGDVRDTLWVLVGAVALVLALACVNIANLLLGRGVARRREMAVRTALGAGGARLARQLLVESSLLVAAASGAGVALAYSGVDLFQRIAPVAIPRLANVSVDGTALALALVLAASTALLFGLLPAMQAGSSDLQGVLRGEAPGASSGNARGRRGFRSWLVAAELSLALVLLVAAGLMVRTLEALQDVDPGFDSTAALTADVTLSDRYEADAARARFFEELFARLGRRRTVEAAGAVSSLPLSGPHAATRFHAGDRPEPPAGESPVADIRIVGGEYFRAMEIPLLAGRLFDSRDRADAPRRALITRTGARTLWPELSLADAVGRVARVSWGGYLDFEIVGVVGDVRHAGLDVVPRAMLYWPHSQNAWDTMSLVVRGGSGASGEELVAAVRSEVSELDPELPVYDVSLVRDVVRSSIASRRFTTTVLLAFGISSLLVAGLGVYGVASFFVGQRRREMSLRLALGSSPRRLVRFVVRQALGWTLAGIGFGLAGALALSRYLSSLLYDVRPFDPATVLAVTLFLFLVALAATYVPARQASRLDPAEALRAE